MDPEGKKFGGGKKFVTLVLYIMLFYTNLCLLSNVVLLLLL